MAHHPECIGQRGRDPVAAAATARGRRPLAAGRSPGSCGRHSMGAAATRKRPSTPCPTYEGG
eukprot:11430056-Alexandrium_andersonii.AAC.1